MTDALTFVELTPDPRHLAEIDALREAGGWGPGSWVHGPMMQTGGRVIGLRDGGGELVAMGGAAVNPPTGFICNMMVRPDQKRCGHGRRLFDELVRWLRASGYRSIELEATEEGRPLYEQSGFRVRWQSVGSSLATPPSRGAQDGLAPLTQANWSDVAALDLEATGRDRGELLRLLTEHSGYRDGVVVESSGRTEAYGLRFANRIGPLVARTADAAGRVARELAWRSEPGTIATVGHPHHAAFWQQLGFEVTPFDVRMVLGEEPRDTPGMVYCMLNGGIG